MTVRIYRNAGEKIEIIHHVTHVLTHSAAIVNNGIDIEIDILNPDLKRKVMKVHLDMWDFYGVEVGVEE